MQKNKAKQFGIISNNKVRVIFLFVLTILMISLVSASSWGTYKQGNCVNLSLTTDASSCIISELRFPNSTNIAENITMTDKGNGRFVYQTCNTNLLGTYTAIGRCDTTPFDNDFEVTPSGFIGTLGFYIIILILSLGLIILGYSIEDAWVVILGGMGLVLFGLFVLLYGVDGIKDTAYTYSFGIITILLGVYFAVRGSLEKMNDGLGD